TARLGKRALHHVLAQRAPELHLDAVFALEGARKRGRFRCCYGGVERKRALLARLRDQALSAIGARIRIDRGGLLGLREGRRRPETHEGATCEKRTNRALWRAAPHA